MDIWKRLWYAIRNKTYRGETAELNSQKLLDFLGIDRTLEGGVLSEATYFACLKVLSESIGKLPLKVQQRDAHRGIVTLRGHPFYQCLAKRPNPYMTASTFWATMELCRSHYGNSYAWIDTRDPRSPKLWCLSPKDIKVWYDNACMLADAPDVYYQYSSPQGILVFNSEDVLHFKSHLCLDGLVGISVREQLASTITGNRKAQKMLEALYDSGMASKAVLQYTGTLNDANVKTLVDGVREYMENHGNRNGDTVIPIPVGFSITPLNMKLTDSQFLELRQYSALQIASAFGIKPNQIGDYTKSSYASAEAQQLSFLVDTLLFIIKQYEEEISYKILTDSELADGCTVKFNTNAMLRATFETRMNSLSAAVSNFIYTPNEARELEDLPHVDGGDQLLGNGAAIPVQLAGRQYVKEDEANG